MDPIIKNEHLASHHKLFKAILGIAGASLLLLIFLLIWGGPGPLLPPAPWFIPFVNSFSAITFFAVAFLAIGRHAVLQDSSSFWIGMGAAGFSVLLIFRTLSWPGLLPGGGSIIGRTPGVSAWFLQFGITILCLFLWISATALRPKHADLADLRPLIVSSGWILFLIIGSILVLQVERYLPLLVDPDGSYKPALLVWNLVVATLFAGGAVRSTRSHIESGDALLGYMAIAQIGFAFAILATLMGMRRYDLWWYLTRIIPTCSSLIVLFGLLYEEVQLFRREREKTDLVRGAREELLRNEERFRALVTASSEVLYRMSPDWGEMRQLEGQGFLANTQSNRNWLQEYIHPDDQPRVQHVIHEAIRTKSTFAFEHRVIRADGSLGWTFSRAVPLMDANGKILEWFGAASDITERKQAEEALKQLTQTLEQRVVERTELAEARSRQLHQLAVELIQAEERERSRISDLLHEDLQQILASARLQLESVLTQLPSEAGLEHVVGLLKAAIAKSRSLSQELSPAILNHSDLVTALQWLTRHMAEQFELTIDLDIRNRQTIEHMPVSVFIFRAVQELLFNVVKHAGVKSARVVLSIQGPSIAVRVSDEGRGFAPALLGHSKGGLGLLSLRERASYIGGRLDIESAPGHGTRLTLIVPLDWPVLSASQPDGAASPSVALNSLAASPIGDVRVLIADDHKVMRQGLVRLISGQPGITIGGEAANGREALELARRIQPHVIVMDISMPEMDGIEATRRIKAEQPAVRVIGLTMHEDEQISRSMHAAGADMLVNKAASSAELLQAIYGASCD
jgi:PAS domain S-box-containing protein